MTKTFKDIPIEISYKSLGEDSFSTILNPLLCCTKIYKRSVGFFSSSALDFIGDGIKQLARNGGKIYIATSPKLDEEDIIAIQSGYLDREKIKKYFVSEVQNTLQNLNEENAKVLYQLVKEGILDVKIVYTDKGMYHDKLALLEDFDGNKIVCVGSNNETGTGYNLNYEKTRVYKSWLDVEGRVDDETNEFDGIWSDANENLKVFDFMEAFESELLGKVNNKGVYEKKVIKYEMRPYQEKAKNNWVSNGHKGFFVMATGTGKTITSLYSIKEFVHSKPIFTIIAVPYKHLVEQWMEDTKVFFDDAYIHMVYGEIKDAETKIYNSYLLSQKEYKPIIVITTIKSFFIDRYRKLYKKINYEKVLIVDEAHNFYNSMSDELDKEYPYKLGLSATPVFGNDQAKTETMLKWFGGQVMDFPIEKALGKYLVNYNYYPIFVNATEDDEKNFIKYQNMMLSAIDPVKGIIIDDEKFTLGYRGRLRAISMAEEKMQNIESIFSKIKETDHTIIYCSDGRLYFDFNETKAEREEVRHLEYILKLINQSILKLGKDAKASKFTATENVETRMSLIDSFNRGDIDYLVAIKCLDEGINIPSIKCALILSSNDNYREFVQRRGRILRLYDDGYSKKEIANIYDVIVLPSYGNKNFAEIEFRRYFEYTRLAKNKETDQLLKKLDDYLYDYGLTRDDIKFKNDYAYGGDLDE